jgi:hypothetical protein
MLDIPMSFSKGQIQVFDALGRSVFQQIVAGTAFFEINTSDWHTGLYFLRLSDGQKIFEQRIVKLRDR